MHWVYYVLASHFLFDLLVIIRVVLKPHREPASRVAWIIVIATLPYAGILAYLLFGETNVGHRRVARLRRVLADLPMPSHRESQSEETLSGESQSAEALIPGRHLPLFRVGWSISGFEPVGGNSAQLLPDSNATIEAMVEDIDAAQETVHLSFYIWLTDNNGCKVVEALKRAAGRGVKCRALADGLGSRLMIKSSHWKSMREAGVKVAAALPIGNPLLRPFFGRIDLRNHRKIVVVDGRITYCGSQNCADPEFRVKAKYAPWVDAMMRFEGPIARQNQYLFASDWMTDVDEDLADLLREPQPPATGGVPAQVVGTGPTVRFSSMPEMFSSLMHAARRELVISSPYFVPNETIQSALCAAAYRGVDTTIIFPERNDSWIVAAASRSYYAELLEAGVKIHEYRGGLLHTKSLTLDGEVSLIGSANMDRRSFDLNYENNILYFDEQLTAAFRQRQQDYLGKSREVTMEEVASWSVGRRFWNNTVAMVGPIL